MHYILFTVLILGAQAAGTAFWVSVGSFQDTTVAERVKEQAATALDEPFAVQQAQTTNGVLQRVATGPFSSREEALSAQARAQASGYSDSWIFATSDAATLAESNAVDAADDTSSSRVLNDDAAADSMGHGSSDQAPPQGAQPTLQEALKKIKEVPTAIPPGYQLNQLFRDGVVPTPDTKQP